MEDKQPQVVLSQETLANGLFKYIVPHFNRNGQVQLPLGLLRPQEREIQQVLAQCLFQLVNLRLAFKARASASQIL